MKLKTVIEEDFSNYKKPSMLLCFPSCTFKCDLECGEHVCQNSEWAKQEDMDFNPMLLVNKYMKNPITSALVCGGLEPMDSFEDLKTICRKFREYTKDDIVIYTGYMECEIYDEINELREFAPVIVKFGRYIPYQDGYFDEVLGVDLASHNQYAKIIA